MIAAPQHTVVVIGSGMVGLRFCEQMIALDKGKRFRIVTFCEESRSAFDRVGLTSFFAHRDAEKLLLSRREWYESVGIELHIGERVTEINRERKSIRSIKDITVGYDKLILAKGSYPIVPPIPGIQKHGVFIYRTAEDLEHIIAYSKNARSCAVIGGGILGLRVVKAAFDLGLRTHVIELRDRLMPRQLDEAGSRIIQQKIQELGIGVHLSKSAKEVHGEGSVQRIEFDDGTSLDCEMLIVSAGVCPRDDLAKECELQVGERGGIVVNDRLQTSDPDIFAIGECTLHGGEGHGLNCPGYTMAEIVAANLCGEDRVFRGTDFSTKVKIMGIDVASFGNHKARPEVENSLICDDPISGTYKRLFFSADDRHLLGGLLIGDVSEYAMLSIFAKSGAPLPCAPRALMTGNPRGASVRGFH